MEICSVDGSKMQINVQGDDQKVADQIQPCPYLRCSKQHYSSFQHNSHIFAAPVSFALFPKLFYQSPKPLASWVTPPSAAPPVQA